jgi:rod shape-determining protein MreB
MIGERTAEMVKIKIGSATVIDQESVMDVKGRDLVDGLPKTIEVNSKEIREAMSEPLAAILGSIKEALERCPPELAADLVDRGIMLAGGGALLGGLDVWLTEQTGVPTHLSEDPLIAVVEGTGRVLSEVSYIKKMASGGV